MLLVPHETIFLYNQKEQVREAIKESGSTIEDIILDGVWETMKFCQYIFLSSI